MLACGLVSAKNNTLLLPCVDLAKQVVHCCFSCFVIYLFLYAPERFLSLTCLLPADELGLRVGRFKPANACYSSSLSWESIVLPELLPLPAFLCLILSLDWWLPGSPTCPPVSAPDASSSKGSG